MDFKDKVIGTAYESTKIECDWRLHILFWLRRYVEIFGLSKDCSSVLLNKYRSRENLLS